MSFYGFLGIHRTMLRDEVRNQVFRQAIRDTVRPGDVVLDLGAGTGILSLFAAQAGAARVYAVERSPIARFAETLIRQNGFQDHIEVIEGDIRQIRLPSKVDVIVSEWLGAFGVDENMLAPLLLARDRWLLPGGRMVPFSVTAWLAPLFYSELDDEFQFWNGHRYELDLGLIARAAVNEVYIAEPNTVSELAAEPAPLWTTDVRSESFRRALLPFRRRVRFRAARKTRLNSLTTWFTAELGEKLSLTNQPGAKTHWARFILPLLKTHHLPAGAEVDAAFYCFPTDSELAHFAWSVKVGDAPWEHHDTRAAGNGILANKT